MNVDSSNSMDAQDLFGPKTFTEMTEQSTDHEAVNNIDNDVIMETNKLIIESENVDEDAVISELSRSGDDKLTNDINRDITKDDILSELEGSEHVSTNNVNCDNDMRNVINDTAINETISDMAKWNNKSIDNILDCNFNSVDFNLNRINEQEQNIIIGAVYSNWINEEDSNFALRISDQSDDELIERDFNIDNNVLYKSTEYIQNQVQCVSSTSSDNMHDVSQTSAKDEFYTNNDNFSKHKSAQKQTTMFDFFTELRDSSDLMEETLISKSDDSIIDAFVDPIELITKLLSAKVVLERIPASVAKRTVSKDIAMKNPLSVVNRYCSTCDEITTDSVTPLITAEKRCLACTTLLWFICLKCKTQCKTYNGLRYHMNSKCFPEKLFSCTTCDYKTTVKSSIIRHSKSGHRKYREKLLQDSYKNELINKTQKETDSVVQLDNKHEVNQDSSSESIDKDINEIHSKSIEKQDKPTTLSHDETQFTVTKNKFNASNMIRRYCSKCDATTDYTTLPNTKNCQTCGTLLLLECIKCKKQYESYSAMVYHLQSKCYPMTYFRCDKCNYTCSVKNLMMKHVKNRHNQADQNSTSESNNPIKLDECLKCGKQVKNVNYHMKFCGKEPDFLCQYCPYKSKYSQNLKKHLRHSHPEQTKENFHFAKVRNTGIPNFKTNVDCSKFSKVESNFNTLTTNDVDNTAKFSVMDSNRINVCINMIKKLCTKCTEVITDISSIKRENMPCKKCGAETILQCLKCNKQYQHYNSILYHMESKCCPQNHFRCSKCDYTTTVRNTMLKHMITHKEIYKTCPKCGRSLKFGPSFKSHIRRCGMTLNMRCKICPYRTKFSHNFKKHMRVHLHPNESNESNNNVDNNVKVNDPAEAVFREAYCPRCDKPRMSESRLNVARCRKCRTRLTNPKSNISSRYIVTGCKDINGVLHQCTNCGKGFSYPKNLRMHEAMCAAAVPSC